MKTIEQIEQEGQAQVCAKILGRDVTRAELSAAFNQVADKSNWKKAINAVVALPTDFDVLLVREAVIFFTGSVPTINVARFTGGRVLYRVQAAGYYQAVGS